MLIGLKYFILYLYYDIYFIIDNIDLILLFFIFIILKSFRHRFVDIFEDYL